jgi:membrane-associated phospholipid phosphatase
VKKYTSVYLKIILPVCCLFLCNFPGYSQTDSLPEKTTPEKVYKMHLKYELPGAGVFVVASYFGFRALDRTATMTADEVAKLNVKNINSFDRSVVNMNPAGFEKAQSRSDFFLNFSIASPILLMVDKRIRRDWLDLLTLYMASHAVDNAIYFGAAFSVRRARPFTYNPDIPIELRTGEAKSNSFFSGHVSFAATSTFFLAKVLTDYHHIKGWQRVAIFGVAAIPPAMVGYYRMRSARHFKTDVLLGLLIGGTSGIVIPELHRITRKHNNISMLPYFAPGGASGLTFNIGF